MDESLLSLFWGACGAAGPLRLQVDGDVEGSGHWSLPQPFAVIGRDVQADVTLFHDHVSKRHAYVQVIAGRVFCADLGSRAGIRWEEASRPSGRVEGARCLGIGPFEIRLAADEPVCSGREAAPADQDDLPPCFLEALNLRSRPSWRIGQSVTLMGRSPKCQVLVSDQGISRFHCSLLRTPLGIWAVDLLGPGGIAVNGQSLRAAYLDDGDDLRVGRVLYRIRYGSTTAPRNALDVRPRIGALARRAPKPSSLAQVQPSAAPGEPAPPSWPVPVHAPSRILVEPTADPRLALMVEQFDRMQQEMYRMQQQTCDQFHQTIMAMFQMFGVMHRDQMDVVHEELAQIRRLSAGLKALQDRAAQGSIRQPSSATVAPPDQEPPSSENAQPSPLRPAVEPVSERATGVTDVRIHMMLSQRIAELQRERQTRWQRLLGLVGGKC